MNTQEDVGLRGAFMRIMSLLPDRVFFKHEFADLFAPGRWSVRASERSDTGCVLQLRNAEGKMRGTMSFAAEGEMLEVHSKIDLPSGLKSTSCRRRLADFSTAMQDLVESAVVFEDFEADGDTDPIEIITRELEFHEE